DTFKCIPYLNYNNTFKIVILFLLSRVHLETFRRHFILCLHICLTCPTERKYLKKEIERLTNIIDEAPDPVELAEMKGNFTGMQKLLEEKDKRIEDLTREVETLNVFAHYFKAVEPRQIEAPEVKRPWWKFW